jgi:hypothetical protein
VRKAGIFILAAALVTVGVLKTFAEKLSRLGR